MRARTRPAINLVELIVLLAILAILLGLLLPAIQKVRAAANRMSSANNLKQLALACHNFHDTNNHFPPGVDANHFSAAARLLPYIEHDALYKTIDFDKSVDDKANAEARKVRIQTFLDPRDPQETVTEDSGPTNYLFNAGSKPSLKENDGVFFEDSQITLADITDGTSNTIMIGQTLKGDGGKKAVDVRRQYVALPGKGRVKKLTDQSGVKEWQAGKDIKGDRGASWMDGRFLQGTFTATRKINDARPDVSADGGMGGLSALRTEDGGGPNVAFCDGSVHVIKSSVDLKIWQLLNSRNDGTAVDSADYEGP
jgi:prepilin-type processing-associated H-X9-DG protein